MTPRSLDSQQIGIHILLIVAAFLALTLLQISLTGALSLLVVLSVMGRFGRVLAQAGGFGEVGIGVGLISGIGVQVLATQVLLRLGLPSTISHLTTFVVLSILVVAFKRTIPAAVNGAQHLPLAEAFAALSIAILVLSLRHPWALPLGLSVALVERSISGRAQRLKMTDVILFLSVLTLGWLASTFTRSSRWWYLYLTGETGYFESIGWISSYFGVSEHPGLSGGSIAGYHWLSYTLLGSLAQLSSLEPWVLISTIGLPLSQFAMALMLMRTPFHKVQSHVTHPVWVTSLIVVTGTSQVRYDSSYFGLVSSLAVLVIAMRFRPRATGKVTQLAVLSLIAFTAIMVKTPAAVAIGAVLALTLFIGRGKDTSHLAVPALSLLISFVIAYVTFFRDSSYTSASTAGATNSLSKTLWIALNGVPYAGWTSVLLLLFFAVAHAVPRKTAGILRTLFVAATICWIGFNVISMVADHGYQMANPSLFLVGVLATWGIQTGLQYLGPVTLTARQKLLSVSSLALGVGTGFVFPVLTNRADAVVKFSELLGVDAWEFVGDHFVYSIPLLVGILALKRPRESRAMHIMMSLALCLGLAAGLQLDRARRVATWGPEVAVNWALNDSAQPNDDLRAVGSYVRQNTDPDVILATNDFCCFGSEWWREIANNPEQHRSGSLKWWSTLERTQWWKNLENQYGVDFITKSVTDTLWGGDNYLVAAETRRRVLIQGLKFQVLTGLPTQDQVNRMTLSLEFANNPSGPIVNQLRGYGVSGYIVNLKLTSQRSWSEFADELYRSGDFVYLELR